MQRVWVVGNSGSGKSTVARALAERLTVPHVELDAIYHQAGWRPLEHEEFRARVAAWVAEPAWIVDGNYSAVAGVVLPAADTVVWIDLTRSHVMRQLTGRTLHRTFRRQELWNGNRESLRGMLSRDPEKSIILWAWRNHDKYARRYAELARQSAPSGSATDPGRLVVRLRSRREITEFLAGIGPGPT